MVASGSSAYSNWCNDRIETVLTRFDLIPAIGMETEGEATLIISASDIKLFMLAEPTQSNRYAGNHGRLFVGVAH